MRGPNVAYPTLKAVCVAFREVFYGIIAMR